MNNKYNFKSITIILLTIIIILFILFLNKSYGYDIANLKDGDLLIGNDIYDKHISPNKLISSSINYYKETKEKPIVVYKYSETIDSENNWLYLNELGEYEKISEENLIKLEINRIIHKAKNKLDSLSNEELKKKSSHIQENRYYFFDYDLIKEGISFAKQIEGYLIYEKNKVIDYNFYYKDKKYEKTYNEETEQKIIRVSDYNAIVNDGIDDTEAIKKAVEELSKNNGGILLFEKGEYNVSIENEFPIYDNKVQYTYYYQKAYPYNTVIDIRNLTGRVIVDLNGATLKLDSNTMPGYKIILIFNCKDVTIKNGELIGDRKTHLYDPHLEAGESSKYIKMHAWGYGINIINSNTVIDNIDIKEFTGDGIFYIDRDIRQVSSQMLYNINISHCRRNGLTIEDLFKITANKVNIYNVGDSDGIQGTAPKAGIDIESEWVTGGIPTKNIYFNNFNIENNTEFAIVSGESNYTENFNISNSFLKGRTNFFNANITNSIFENDCGKTGPSSLTDITAENTEFYVTNHEGYLYINGKSNINNSILKGKFSDTTGNYLKISKNTILTNSEISNFQGYHLLTNESDGTTKVIRYSKDKSGLIIKDDASKNWEYNTFDNCFIVLSIEKNDNKSEYYNVLKNNTINNSTLWYHNDYEKTTLNLYNINFNNTILKSYESIANYDSHSYLKEFVSINIYDSNLYNSIFDNGNIYANNTNIVLDNLDRKLHYIKKEGIKAYNTEGIYDNSVIKINNNVSSRDNFEIMKLINNSTIILNKYNSNNPIINTNSILDYDYKIIYNGDISLN